MLLEFEGQRPLGSDEVRIREVFEQQVPCAGIRGLGCLKAAWHQLFRLRGRDIAVERDFAAVGVRRTIGVIKVPILRIRELGASRAGPSYSSRSRKVCDRSFRKEAITATLQTDASPSEPDRRSASVRCSAPATFGKGSAVISIYTDTSFRLRLVPHIQPPCRIWVVSS
jgi:hypothetical protein